MRANSQKSVYRRVAAGLTPDSSVARRFADEARITAPLQHTAISPVPNLVLRPPPALD